MSNSTTTGDPVGWVAEPRTRGTMGLLYSCLFTMFICTWSALHMNVPADTDSRATIVLRKLKWMAVGILAPEYIVALAVSDWCGARLICKELWPSKAGRELAHGFLVLMGGIAIETTDQNRISLRADHFVQAVRKGIIEVPQLESKEIGDRSKADWVSKSVACVQIGWLLAQVIGRTAQHVSVTPLEMFSLGIVVCAIATYSFWWKKPFDVQTPVVINTELDLSALKSKLAAEMMDSSIQNLEARIGLMDNGTVDTLGNTRVLIAVTTLTVSILFGLCHVAAWGFAFPTFWERLLWRVSAVACVALPVVILGLIYIEDYLGLLKKWQKKWIALLYDTLFAKYILVRVFLLVEVFISLRSVPPDVYKSVDWAAYIPHI